MIWADAAGSWISVIGVPPVFAVRSGRTAPPAVSQYLRCLGETRPDGTLG
jgi:hypothetical protein